MSKDSYLISFFISKRIDSCYCGGEWERKSVIQLPSKSNRTDSLKQLIIKPKCTARNVWRHFCTKCLVYDSKHTVKHLTECWITAGVFYLQAGFVACQGRLIRRLDNLHNSNKFNGFSILIVKADCIISAIMWFFGC